jgi:APA family basic amino acid/polyamine antiporter
MASFGFLANILKKRSPDEIIARSKSDALAKTLTWKDIFVLGISAVIGSGIFVMVGEAACGNAEHVGAGPALILSIVLAAIACIFPALCYAEFASAIPDSGSSYTYTYTTMGEFIAWMVGWILILEYSISNITISAAWSGYLFELLAGYKNILPDWLINPPLWLIHDYSTVVTKYHTLGYDISQIPHIFGIPFAINLPAIFIMIVIAIILTKGTKESTRTATIMVIIKMAVILLFIIVAAFYVKPENWGTNLSTFAPNGIKGILLGTFIIFYAYLGFDALATASEETKNPQKNLPIGILGTMAAACFVYSLVALAFTGIVPVSQYPLVNIHAPIAHVIRIIHQDWIAGWISLGAIAGLTSVLLVLQYANSRILFAMARDSFLPKIMRKRHPKYKTPYIIIWTTIICISICSLFVDMSVAAQLCIFGTLTCFIMICLAMIISRKLYPNLSRPFKMPFCPITPIIGIGICLVLIIQAMPNLEKASVLFPLWLFAGALIYVFFGYRQHRLIEEKNIILKEKFIQKYREGEINE